MLSLGCHGWFGAEREPWHGPLHSRPVHSEWGSIAMGSAFGTAGKAGSISGDRNLICLKSLLMRPYPMTPCIRFWESVLRESKQECRWELVSN